MMCGMTIVLKPTKKAKIGNRKVANKFMIVYRTPGTDGAGVNLQKVSLLESIIDIKISK